MTGEITYGLERIAMYIQGVNSMYELRWNDDYSYGDICHQNEVEMSKYNFELADVDTLFKQFDIYEQQSLSLSMQALPLPAYEMVLKASHTFNLLDARHAVSVTERARYIGRVRNMAKAVAQEYYNSREKLGFPRGSQKGGQHD